MKNLALILIINLLIILVVSSFLFKFRGKLKKYVKFAIVAMITILLIADIIIYNYMNDTKTTTWESDVFNYTALHKYSEGETAIIALIDSGISSFESDLVEKNVSYVDDNNLFDTNGHGTIMCSLLKGYDNISGIAPDATVYSYKIMDETGKTSNDVIIKAINQAILDNVDIINLSLGSFKNNEELNVAINDAISKGITVISSAGDYEADDMLYPAKFDNVISVGAISEDGEIWIDTNDYKDCDILAPGVNITSINIYEKVEETTGTSQATALISGYVSLLKDYCDVNQIELTNDDIKAILNEVNNGRISYAEGFQIIDKSN